MKITKIEVYQADLPLVSPKHYGGKFICSGMFSNSNSHPLFLLYAVEHIVSLY